MRFSQNLEQAIDNLGLAEVLDTIADICWEKASCARANGRDERLVDAWNANGCLLEKLAAKVQPVE